MPRRIECNEIEPGMILDEDVINNFGQTILIRDTTIEYKHIRLFKIWNVKSIAIKFAEYSELYGQINNYSHINELNPELIEKSKEILAERIYWSPENPYEDELYKLGLLHTINAHCLIR